MYLGPRPGHRDSNPNQFPLHRWFLTFEKQNRGRQTLKDITKESSNFWRTTEDGCSDMTNSKGMNIAVEHSRGCSVGYLLVCFLFHSKVDLTKRNTKKKLNTKGIPSDVVQQTTRNPILKWTKACYLCIAPWPFWTCKTRQCEYVYIVQF